MRNEVIAVGAVACMAVAGFGGWLISELSREKPVQAQTTPVPAPVPAAEAPAPAPPPQKVAAPLKQEKDIACRNGKIENRSKIVSEDQILRYALQIMAKDENFKCIHAIYENNSDVRPPAGPAIRIDGKNTSGEYWKRVAVGYPDVIALGWTDIVIPQGPLKCEEEIYKMNNRTSENGYALFINDIQQYVLNSSKSNIRRTCGDSKQVRIQIFANSDIKVPKSDMVQGGATIGRSTDILLDAAWNTERSEWDYKINILNSWLEKKRKQFRDSIKERCIPEYTGLELLAMKGPPQPMTFKFDGAPLSKANEYKTAVNRRVQEVIGEDRFMCITEVKYLGVGRGTGFSAKALFVGTRKELFDLDWLVSKEEFELTY